MEQCVHSRLVVPALIVTNLLSFVGIVILTKYLFVYAHWKYPTLLVVLHQLTGALAMGVGRVAGWMKPPQAPWTVGFKLAVPGAASIFLLNLSLLYNSVSMYQMFKLLTVPLMCVAEFVMARKRHSSSVLASLTILVIGIGLVTVTEVSFALLGLGYGLAAAAVVAVQQPYAKLQMTTYNLNSAHVLHLQCFLCATLLAMGIPTTEDLRTLPSFRFSSQAVVPLVGSCLSFVVLGLSQMAIIGRTSAVTFQVVGLSKTVLTVLTGIFTFRTPVTLQNAAGLAL
eukprot:RCo053772